MVMLKKYIKILSNPLLYYKDKEGNSVFRNFSPIKQTGNLYHTEFSKSQVGKALEFRFELDKKLKLAYFLITIILYFIFIHIRYSIWGLLFFIILWTAAIIGIRYYCGTIYKNFLLKNYGIYQLTEFEPPISKRKAAEFVALFRSKIILTVLALVIFFAPTFLLSFGIKHCLTSKHNGYKHAVTLSNIYNSVYPKSAKIYDMRAVAHFMMRDYDKSLDDYIMAIELSGKKFTKRDYVRFENLLLVKKKVASSQEAVDTFNKYISKKRMSVLQKSQMLWVKSIFKIENSIIDSILQEYDELLSSLKAKDTNNQFYISCDRAYMLYLMQQYQRAIDSYDELILYADENQQTFAKELQSLYAERGWAKARLGDNDGANLDFKTSDIPAEKLGEYEPSYVKQAFVREKF